MKSEKKLQEKLIKSIEKSNKIFNESTKAQKRVMIAQDCIDRLACKLLSANTGSFITYAGAEVNQERVNTIGCEVCAKGGLFASYIGRVNNFSDDCIGNDKDDLAHKKLLEVFTLRQLAIIEYAFEGTQYIYSVDIPYDLEKKLEKFYDEIFYDDDKRLIKICENIIKNKGTFKL
jgi:hypothetical protein